MSNRRSPKKDYEPKKKPQTPKKHPRKVKKDSLNIDRSVQKHLKNIGQPEAMPFVPDDFQLEAIKLVKHHDVIVSAPTGSGKTWIAQKAIEEEIANGKRVWYTSPLKALSNAKFLEFGNIFGKDQVGLLTGDLKLNTSSPIIVGTTEILRNQLYDSMTSLQNINYDLVILDEAHYLGDSDRGVVWEEVLIYLPARIRLLLLSATIENANDIAKWMERNRRQEVLVVQGGKRPVDLIPLCLSENKLRLLTTIVKKGVDTRVSGWFGSQAVFLKINTLMEHLAKLDLLPAIFFLKSRTECDKCVHAIRKEQIENKERYQARKEFIDEYLVKHPEIRQCSPITPLYENGVAAHHAGHLPYYKMLIEELMTRGLLSAIFATSTVSAGVNFPARTVVIPQSDRFDGNFFKSLTATELAQMTGRAGRRGQDLIGFVLLIPGPFMNLKLMNSLFKSPPNPIRSCLKINFSMVLNLLESMRMEEVKDLLSRSFMAWQKVKEKTDENLEKASQDSWEDFNHHAKFLQRIDLIDEFFQLTTDGKIAAKLRLEYPLVYFEALKKNALPETPELLAATVAVLGDRFVNAWMYRKIPEVERAASKFMDSIMKLIQELKNGNFPFPRKNIYQAMAVYTWVKHGDFIEATRLLGRGPGDMVRLALMTAEVLNQLGNLEEYYPELSSSARIAVSLLLKPPVV
jgi:superfamily II RNA helicase